MWSISTGAPSQDRVSATTLTGYVLFFPHLIAGPILRPIELIPQLRRPRSALSAHFYAGLAIFTVGLVKKLVFADQIAAVVDAAYKADVLSAPQAWLAIYGFSMQIYCDFSGYTDMAIGLALVIGIRLPNNFLAALRRLLADRLLAALAHYVVVLAARLSLHSARRQPRRAVAHLCQHDHHDDARRTVAWRQLDVRDLGRAARRRRRLRAFASATCCVGRVSRGNRSGGMLSASFSRFILSLCCGCSFARRLWTKRDRCWRRPSPAAIGKRPARSVTAQSGAVLLLAVFAGAARLRRSPDDQARHPPHPAGNRSAADRPVVGFGHDDQPRQLHEIHLFRFLIGGAAEVRRWPQRQASPLPYCRRATCGPSRRRARSDSTCAGRPDFGR